MKNNNTAKLYEIIKATVIIIVISSCSNSVIMNDGVLNELNCKFMVGQSGWFLQESVIIERTTDSILFESYSLWQGAQTPNHCNRDEVPIKRIKININDSTGKIERNFQFKKSDDKLLIEITGHGEIELKCRVTLPLIFHRIRNKALLFNGYNKYVNNRLDKTSKELNEYNNMIKRFNFQEISDTMESINFQREYISKIDSIYK